MKQPCPLFDNWIERQPRRDLSPAFEAHLENCPDCRNRLAALRPVADALITAAPLPDLSPDYISDLGIRMRCELIRRQNRRLGVGLFGIGLLCLPIVFAVNYFWGSILFNLISAVISPTVAWIVLGMFISGTVGISGLVYCSLPILAGWRLIGQTSEISS